MVKKAIKKILSTSCVAALLMTTPGMSLLADDLQEGIIVNDVLDDSSIAPVAEESGPEVIGKDLILETDELSEDSARVEVESEGEIVEEYSSFEEVMPDIDVDTAIDSVEEIVGANTWTVGDGVTASLVTEGDKDVLYFDSNGGTLWNDWRSKLGSSAGIIDIIKFTSKSTKMYLPSYTSYLFAGSNYLDNALNNLEQIQLDKIDTSNVTNMREMFYGCSSLTTLDLSQFDTSNVTDMQEMFNGCSSLTTLDLSQFDTSNVTNMSYMFVSCSSLTTLDVSKFNTSNVTNMSSMFHWCSSLTALDLSKLNTSNVTNMSEMFYGCSSLTALDLSKLNTSNVTNMSLMFRDCNNLTTLDVSKFNTSNVTNMSYMFENCYNLTALDLSSFNTSKTSKNTCDLFGSVSFNNPWESLTILKTPKYNNRTIYLPRKMCDDAGNEYTELPILSESIVLKPVIVTPTPRPRPTITPTPIIRDISKCSVAGVSLSYGYSGKAYAPTITVKLDGKTLTKDKDYTVEYINNKKPGTAVIIIVGTGVYTGVKIKTFEIVDCVSSVVSGRTYQLIPKNNSDTAVSSFSGKMVNNTKVYITDRSSSEAMKFKAIKNSDGTWKFINAKCELALAVQQNSSAAGAGLVLYDQTTKPAQNWKLEKKSDNSFAIRNAVTGYSIAMSDASAVKGTTLSMAVSESSGLQRFYIAETSAVSAPFDGTKSVRASKDKNFALNIASSSKTDGANVNLYTYTNTNAKKFKIMYSGGGYYRLVNVNSGMCLTVNGNSKTDGANVIQSKWAAQSGQRWKITKNADGTATLTNALGTVLHLTGNKTVNGTNIVAKNASTSSAQKWYLQ